MKFIGNVPNFIETDPIINQEEISLEEILDHPWIQEWNKGQKNFRYCWAEYEGKWIKAVLMADWINDKGYQTRCVLGYMSEIPKTLPKWKHEIKTNRKTD